MSAETKWTPGPWKIVQTGDGFSYIASPQSIEMKGHIPSYWKHTVATDFSGADAHLIAAAPEMYAALVKVRDSIASVLILKGIGPEHFDRSLELSVIDTALAKARGEAK